MRTKRVYRKKNKEFWAKGGNGYKCEVSDRKFYVYLRELHVKGSGLIAKAIDIDDARILYKAIASTKSYAEKHGGKSDIVCPF